jgi:predicted aspartyl protease
MQDGKSRDVWGPMLKVSLSDSTVPTIVNIIATDLLALVDTGADVCYIDTSLATQHNMQSRNTLSAISSGGSTNASVYIGQIILEGRTNLQMAMVGIDLRARGFRHRFLIGMEALRYFEMTMRRQSGSFSLLWVGA